MWTELVSWTWNVNSANSVLSFIDLGSTRCTSLLLLPSCFQTKVTMAEEEEEAPPEVHHYRSRAEVPWDIQKYYSLIQ